MERKISLWWNVVKMKDVGGRVRWKRKEKGDEKQDLGEGAGFGSVASGWWFVKERPNALLGGDCRERLER